jgi:hypothetical protein
MAFYSKTDKTEFFPTPQNLVDKLWSFFPEELAGKNVTVFDSCAGAGALCRPTTLPEGNFTFIQWDLNPRAEDIEQHDFFATELPEADIAICNPPFGMKKEWVARLLSKYKYVILLCPKSAFVENWDAVLESGKEPDLTIENMSSFSGRITTPIMIGILKQLPPFHQPMTSKEKKTLFKQYIDRLVHERCHLEEWRKAFAYSAEHPELTANEVFDAIGWRPE